MSSELVCARCGISVHQASNGWRHTLGGKTGAIPAHMRHYPVPVLRTDFERAFGIHTPADEARAILERFRSEDRWYQKFGSLTTRQRMLFTRLASSGPMWTTDKRTQAMLLSMEKKGVIVTWWTLPETMWAGMTEPGTDK